LRAFLFIVFCLLLVSCFDKGDCLFTNTNVVKVSFMDAAKPLQPKPVVFDSVFLPFDNLYTPSGDTISTLMLVTNPRVNETAFVFQYAERSDTLVLGYSTQTLVLSPDCGSYNFQSNLEVLHSTFGDGRVVVTNPRLLNSVTNNMEIFF
jgi:hypothetical protein